MCGICGTAGFADTELLNRMVRLIVHRGPDDQGVFVTSDKMFGLGNCRLSIIDLSAAGHMPMCNEDETVWITYNGEIYNFHSIRTELQKLGHTFRSRTDTEILIHGYEEWGVRLLERLNGMFGLALLDLRQKPARLLLARDRLGIKPVYYTSVGGRLVYASEIKAILLAPGIARDVDLNALHRYLAFLWVPGPETLFKGIYKLPPGHYLEWSEGEYSLHCYWSLRFPPALANGKRNEKDLSVELLEILRRAVKRHLISDVPVGVFLSGGLDSSTILALAAELTNEPVKSYTIAYRPEDALLEQSDADKVFARLAARRMGADHHEIEVNPDIVDLLPKVVWHLDEPVADPAAISTYLICREGRPEVKVLLSGQGADEVFAGYRLHWTHRLASILQQIPSPVRRAFARYPLGALPAVSHWIPGVRPGFLLAVHRYWDKLLAGVDLSPEERYVFYRSYYTDDQEFAMYSPELREALIGAVAGDRHLAYFRAVPDADFLDRMLYVDVKTFLIELNLTYCDKLSSAASVEVRVPFLDTEVVDFMASVPPEMKLRGLTSKYILRRAVESVVPREIVHRRKAAFGAPIRAWLRRDLHDMVDELLSDKTLRERGYFQPGVVRAMVEQDRRGQGDHTLRIWALLSLELWHRTFMDSSLSSLETSGINSPAPQACDNVSCLREHQSR
ncbi:MAG: asparagine synthase (glutamine-hydrolyzing) [Terriglobia bacterium]